MHAPLFIALVKPLFPLFFGLLALGVLFVALTRGLGGPSQTLGNHRPRNWPLTFLVWALALFFLAYGATILHRVFRPSKHPGATRLESPRPALDVKATKNSPSMDTSQ